MKPSKIMNVLDIARNAVALGENFYPLFSGAPGIAKSQIVQQWANKNNLPFIDIRAAYLESPDVIGFPSIEVKEGRQVTVHNIPEFWPQDPNWEGVILLEEPNRGTASILNTFMQLLTDRKVHKYVLPKKAMIVGCINPESTQYEVTNMDPALKNRFVIYEVAYDKQTFVDYMKVCNWSPEVIRFVESGVWQYALPENIKDAPGAKYISPRTLAQLNSLLLSTQDNGGEDALMHYQSILGNNVGKDFYAFMTNESPVLYHHLADAKTKKAALKKLEKFSDPKNYKNGLISITVSDIVNEKVITDELLAEVVEVIPVEKGTDLIRELSFAKKDDKLLTRMCTNFPKVKELFKSTLAYGKDSNS